MMCNKLAKLQKCVVRQHPVANTYLFFDILLSNFKLVNILVDDN